MKPRKENLEWDEEERLRALRHYQILDTPPEEPFDDIVRFIAEFLEVPMAAVSLVTEDRQWFKAETGLGIKQTPVEYSFCAVAMRQSEVMVVPDTLEDARFRDNPLVQGKPYLRFYAGEPLLAAPGLPLGALCALDTKPHSTGLTPRQRSVLQLFARHVERQLETRRAMLEREATLVDQFRFEVLTRQIIDSVTDHAIISLDLEGRIRTWNAGARNILGWTMKEMIGQPADRIYLPSERISGRFQADLQSAVASGRIDHQRWHLRKDGGTFFGSGTIMPLRTDDGLLSGLISILRDQTDEYVRQRRLELLAKASSALLSAPDPDDVLAPILKESAHLLGFDQSYSFRLTADGSSLQLTQSIGDNNEFGPAFPKWPFCPALSNIVVETEKAFIVPDLQSSTDVRFASARLYGLSAYAGFPVSAGGRMYGVLAFVSVSRSSFDDEAIAFFATLASYLSVVRKRLEHEAQLVALAETLEQRVEERTAELQRAEEQLRQAQKMEAIGQLTSSLAHDFNNLLAAISGSLELLQVRVAQGRIDELDRYIVSAQGASRRAAALTHRLLAFSRQQTLNPKPTDVNRLLGDMEDLIRRTVGPAITVEVVGTDRLWTSFIDASQLDSALLNLCINARDAMPDGGCLTIRTANRYLDDQAAREHELPPGQYISLCVSDTGTGMTPETIARAFDPFFTTKPIGMGTGLGLSMVYGFALQSRGQVRILSEMNKGTTVCLFLPRCYKPEDRAAVSHHLFTKVAGGTVLVVDDEPNLRSLITEVIEQMGYQVTEAVDVAAGMKILQSDADIDLLIADLDLPGDMNSRQMADAARLQRAGLKVLFITGDAENATVNDGHPVAGTQVLTWPFAIDALMQNVRHLMS